MMRMSFKEMLNYYLNGICSSRELSRRTGVSESVISRYRKGERTPRVDSIQLKKICDGMMDIIKEKDILKFRDIDIYYELCTAIRNSDSFDYDGFSRKFNGVINGLKININEMARYINFDASHISRIRYGKTRPSDPISFSKKVADFVVFKYNDEDGIRRIGSLMGRTIDGIDDKGLYGIILDYLTNDSDVKTDVVGNFLNNFDCFDLNDYIEKIHFDTLKVPNIPFYRGKCKNYYGIEEMKDGEIDFFKGTVLGKSMDDIFMCSDMPMEDMAQDMEFGKKWMFAIALCLKKGLHLNIIHNLDRPFNEMMLGLESWVPIYMTGLVSPYYLKEVKNCVYQHLNYVSGNCALTGECILGYHNEGKYYLTNNGTEVAYYRKKADLLLKKAKPLMDIYNMSNWNDFVSFLEMDIKKRGERKRLFSSLPLFTISDDLLMKVLYENGIEKDDIDMIIEYKHKETGNNLFVLKDNVITDYIYKFDYDDVVYLNLDNLLYDKRIRYDYDDYLEHLRLTLEFEKANLNYHVMMIRDRVFKNVSISVILDEYAVLNKSNSPSICFVIRHPKLVKAISDFNSFGKD